MILIPPGEFLMGSSDEQITAAIKDEELESSAKTTGDTTQRQNVLSTEQPRHRVVLTKPFRMSVTEVTVGQFKKFAAAVGYQSKAEKPGGKPYYANPEQTGPVWNYVSGGIC